MVVESLALLLGGAQMLRPPPGSQASHLGRTKPPLVARRPREETKAFRDERPVPGRAAFQWPAIDRLEQALRLSMTAHPLGGDVLFDCVCDTRG
jgi:hypothetical protein